MDGGEEGETWRTACKNCGHVGLEESDGFYYCQLCGAQSHDIILTGVADEDFLHKDSTGDALYSARHARHAPSASAPATPASAQLWFRFTQDDDDDDDDEERDRKPSSAASVRVKKEEEDEEGYDDGVGPTEPGDFGFRTKLKLSYEDYYNEVRIRYVMGLQWMIQMQCEALVDKFRVSPLVCGISGTLWFRYLSTTRVFDQGWADDVFMESEIHTSSELEDRKPNVKHIGINVGDSELGRRGAMVWFRYLRKTIPLSSTLAISFLACHVAREAVLPTDIVKWSLEGKLPYFAAHVEIERRFEQPSPACPISSSLMFRPYQTDSPQKLESMAARIANSIGLHLPPVNFYAIASRFLHELSLPVEKVLPHVCRMYEWSTPPDLWLSTNELRLPTCVCVMSMLIVTIRILFNINGFGEWERSLPNHSQHSGLDNGGLNSVSSKMKRDAELSSCSLDWKDDSGEVKSVLNESDSEKSDLDPAGLLNYLEARRNKICNRSEYMKDLPSYLQYCKDVVFAGAGSSHLVDHQEEEIIEKFWDFYENEKIHHMKSFLECVGYQDVPCEQEDKIDFVPEEDSGAQSGSILKGKRLKCDDAEYLFGRRDARKKSHDTGIFKESNRPGQSLENVYHSDTSLGDQSSDHKANETLKNKAIRRMKLDMEENRFCYIPPRVNLKRFDYLHYVRKKDDGALTYAAHADYYILLDACARVAQIDIRIMHMGVLSFERRLAWLENRIDHSLHLSPPNITCKFCRDVPNQFEDDT